MAEIEERNYTLSVNAFESGVLMGVIINQEDRIKAALSGVWNQLVKLKKDIGEGMDRLRLRITNSDRVLLQTAQAIIGGTITSHYDHTPNHRPSLVIDIKTKSLPQVLPQIIPFLISNKRKMAEILLKAASLQQGHSWRNWQKYVLPELETLYRQALKYRTFKSRPPRKEMKEWGFEVDPGKGRRTL